MATLQAAIDQIQSAVGGISGIRKAPDEPPDKLSQFPIAVAYASEGVYGMGPAGSMTGVHTIVVELHVARKGMPRTVQQSMVYGKSIPNAIYDALMEGNLSAISTLGTIRYEYGTLGWGDLATFGFRFFVEGVKTQDEVS